MKQITEIADARLVKGLAHPLRIEILRALEAGVASPSEIAEQLDAPLGNVSYHVRFLARLKLIELHETRPRRGAVEHYYRIVPGVRVSDVAWAQMPRPVRDTILATTLDEVGRSVGAAVASGGFDHHTARANRIEVTLDRDGLTELSAALAELGERATEIERESAARIAAGAAAIVRGEDKAAMGTDGKAPHAPDVGEVLRAQLVLLLFGSRADPAS